MATAYILLNTEIGAEKQVLKALKKIEGVEEAHHLWGVYDSSQTSKQKTWTPTKV